MDPSVFDTQASLPSIFELLAQSSLRSLLQPAFTYSLTLGANHFPRYLIPLAQRHEEVWTTLLLLVERWSLLKHDASFSEHFYGLKRRRAGRIETTRRDAFLASVGHGTENRLQSRLTRRQIWFSLVELVLLPYLGLKLHDAFVVARTEADIAAEADRSDADNVENNSPSASPTRKERFKKLLSYLLVLLYPSLSTALALGRLGWSVRYLFQRTKYWSPAGLVGGWLIDRISADDVNEPLPSRTTLLSPLTRRLPASPVSLPSLLPTLLLSLKLYEFYHSLPPLLPSTTPTLHPSSHPPLPPPPRPAPPPGAQRPQWGMCAVCGRPWDGPTVLAGAREGAGWVGCWGCFWQLGEQEQAGDEGKEGAETAENTAKGWWRGRVDRDRMRRVLL